MIHFWYCPLPLPFTLKHRLERVGIYNCADPLRLIPGSCLFIYPAPHQFLGQADGAAALQDIIRYGKGSEHVIAIWRLARLDQNSLVRWQHDQDLESILQNEHPPAPDCLEAVLTLKWMELSPRVLEAYLDLEFLSTTFGSPLDSRYVDRLQSAIDVNFLHYAWRQVTFPDKSSKFTQQLHEDLDLRRMQLDLTYEEMGYLNEALQEVSAEVRRLRAAISWQTNLDLACATLSRSQNVLMRRLIAVLLRLSPSS